MTDNGSRRTQNELFSALVKEVCSSSPMMSKRSFQSMLLAFGLLADDVVFADFAVLGQPWTSVPSSMGLGWIGLKSGVYRFSEFRGPHFDHHLIVL
jgi:hypothetical protein